MPTEPLRNYDIDKLHPVVQMQARAFIKASKKVQQIKITEGHRSGKRQNWLYAQGRTRSGKVVTNARAGFSYHQYGLAFDIAFSGPVPYPTDPQLWDEIIRLGESFGLESGRGFGDKPHFQWRGGSKEGNNWINQVHIEDLINGAEPNNQDLMMHFVWCRTHDGYIDYLKKTEAIYSMHTPPSQQRLEDAAFLRRLAAHIVDSATI